MLISYKRGQTSVVLRVKIYDSSVTTGAGLTGLAYNTSGLKIATIADNEAATTVYTVAASNVETITTLGTFATPTASKCRFKEVDATNHPGVYEIHIANARFAVTSAKSLMVSISGATNAAECDVLIPLVDFDPYGASTSNISFAGGLTVTQSATNENAITITGNGVGYGIGVTGGSSGTAVRLDGGASGGSGLHLTADNGVGFNVSGKNDAVRFLGSGSARCLYMESGSGGADAVSIVGVGGAAIRLTNDQAGTAALTIGTTGTNSPAVKFTGNGSGAGFAVVAGATGSAMTLTGGGTSGTGLTVTTTSGNGITVTSGGGNGDAIECNGNGSGHGIDINAGATGRGMDIAGGSTSGAAIQTSATNGNGIYVGCGGSNDALRIQGGTSSNGIASYGNGAGAGILTAGGATGAGLSATGGATGTGLVVTGGGTSGNGITVSTTNGHGFSINAAGASKDGFIIVGAQYDINADIQGTVSGSGGGLDAAGVRAAIGLASANLDTQLSTIDDFLDTEVAAIKAKTDNLPATPASSSDCLNAAGVRTAVGLASANLDTQLLPLTDGVSLATPVGLKKNTETLFTFTMVDSTDHINPLTGLTVTAQRSLDGAALGSCANSVSEISNGIYKVTLAAADTNADILTLRFTATGADPRVITIATEA